MPTKKKIFYNPSEQAIISALGYGKQNAVSRNKLAVLTNKSDRTMRTTIEKLRTEKGLVIASLPNKKGYYFAATYEELEAYRNLCLSRERAEKKKRVAAEKEMRKWKSQQLFDFSGDCHE